MARGGSVRASDLLAERIRALEVEYAVVLIDGGSGSGKTTLGTELAYALGAQLVNMDAFYPGWGGLEVGSAMVRGSVLDAEKPGWRRWDWKKREPAEWHKIRADNPVVIEGSGALSAANREVASFGIWIQLDQAERKRRVLARDGRIYLEYWECWAQQEVAFFTRERPDQLADVVLDGWTGRLLC